MYQTKKQMKTGQKKQKLQTNSLLLILVEGFQKLFTFLQNELFISLVVVVNCISLLLEVCFFCIKKKISLSCPIIILFSSHLSLSDCSMSQSREAQLIIETVLL